MNPAGWGRLTRKQSGIGGHVLVRLLPCVALTAAAQTLAPHRAGQPASEQTPAAVIAPAPATTSSATPSPPVKTAPRRKNPLIDAASAIPDDAILNALQKGGFVLYLRHTETGAITEQCNVSNLSPNGAMAARGLGAQLKQQRIPVGRIQSSPVCRVQETAKLLAMGDVELSDDLAQTPRVGGNNLYAARMKQLATMPPQGANTLVVSHMHGGVPPYQAMDLEFGEIIVFRPDGNGGTRPVARILAEHWPALASVKTVSK